MTKSVPTPYASFAVVGLVGILAGYFAGSRSAGAPEVASPSGSAGSPAFDLRKYDPNDKSGPVSWTWRKFAPDEWSPKEREAQRDNCFGEVVNIFGLEPCHAEVFCPCLVAWSEKQGRTPNQFAMEVGKWAAHASPRAIGHTCTERVVQACGYGRR